MKALEEYKQNKFKTKNVEPDCREAEAYLKGLDEGWKEALEWMLEQGDKSHWVNELSGVIREELEQ